MSEAEETHDLHARMMSMKTAHRSYAVTGAICTAVAASLPGTLVARAARLEEEGTVRIAHPYGVMDVGVSMDFSGPSPRVESARVGRTARLLMSGVVHLSGIALD